MHATKPVQGKIFHALLMDCFASQRRPTEDELDRIASQIWQDSHGSMTGQSWPDVAKGSDAHRQMMSAARMALGVSAEPRQPML